MSFAPHGYRCRFCGEPFERALRARNRTCVHAPDCQLMYPTDGDMARPVPTTPNPGVPEKRPRRSEIMKEGRW